MKLNRKGYTLIELLVVIVIIGLIVGFSTYGVIRALNTSKDNATIISENNIKESASIFANEKINDSERWKDINGKENKYFCTTIEELMNNGLLDKNAQIKDSSIEKFNYIVIRKNKTTMVSSKPEILINSDSDEYKICTGNIRNEEIRDYPKLDDGTSYTDLINVPFTDAIAESSITERRCQYGKVAGNISNEARIENNTCIVENLEDNTPYYIRVCMDTEKGSTICSNTESRTTKKVKAPTININNNINIKYDNTDINGEAGYYFNSEIKGTSNINIKECTLNDNSYNCQENNTTEVKENTWYKSSDKNITITPSNDGSGKIYAKTVDKSNNMAETEKEVSVYKITFKKGTADKIDNEINDISKLCTAEKNKTCIITSPTIEKSGYDIVGWNNNENATTSNWDVGKTKTIGNTDIYYPITKLNVYTITYNANGGSGSVMENTVVKSGDVTAIKNNTYVRQGYTFAGWTTKSDGTDDGYKWTGWSGTWNFTNGQNGIVNNKLTLYAMWQVNKVNKVNIKFSTVGGTVQESTTTGAGNVYKWKQDSNGIISRTNANGSTYSDIFFTINYGNSTSSDGLPNYKNSKYLNITNEGYKAVSGQEWKCLSGCTTAGKVFNQDSSYSSNDFCDASNGDCTVILGVNWEKITYMVNYDANGGKGAPASQVKQYNNNLTLSSTIPTRDGYTFKGWGTSKDTTVVSYKAGGVYTSNNGITLYAIWRVNEVKIKFSTNGGTVKTQTTEEGNTYKWKQDSNNIISKTNANGSTYSDTFFTVNYNGSTTGDGLPDYNNPNYLNVTKTGHNAVNGQEWKCLSGCTISGKVFNQTSVYSASDFCNASNGDCTVTLGINWVSTTYTITLNNQGATSAGTTKVYYQYNTTKTINGTVCYYYTNSTLTNCLTNGYDITKPTKSGYTFGGYYTGTNGSGTIYVSTAGRFTNNAYQTTGDKTLYAKWNVNTKKMYVNSDIGLYCRSTFNTSGTIITAFTCGTIITVNQNATNGWYYVPDSNCYSSGDYLSSSKPTICGSSGGSYGGGTAGCGVLCNCSNGQIRLTGDCTDGKAAPVIKKYRCCNGYACTIDGVKVCG